MAMPDTGRGDTSGAEGKLELPLVATAMGVVVRLPALVNVKAGLCRESGERPGMGMEAGRVREVGGGAEVGTGAERLEGVGRASVEGEGT